MDDKIKLKNAKMYYDKKLKDYFLRLVYEKEDDEGVYEITFPKVFIGIPKNNIFIERDPLFLTDVSFSHLLFNNYMNTGEGGKHTLMQDKNGETNYMKTILTKTKEVTIEEIEKMFGCKVKIVNDKK